MGILRNNPVILVGNMIRNTSIEALTPLLLGKMADINNVI